MKENSYQRFLNTYAGNELLKNHSLDEDGLWQVYGEDPNCNLGGSHVEPLLGTYGGVLREVVEMAVELPGFWQWGGGGRIKKINPVRVKDAHKRSRRKNELLRQRDAIEKELKELEES